MTKFLVLSVIFNVGVLFFQRTCETGSEPGFGSSFQAMPSKLVKYCKLLNVFTFMNVWYMFLKLFLCPSFLSFEKFASILIIN